MLQSQLFVPTLREVPKEAVIASHQLLLKGGYIKMNAAGIYTYLPLALRIIRKIEAIVREELNAIGCSELLMPALQLKELWQESGRWEVYGKELIRLTDRHEREFCLGPTHEEVITSIVRDNVSSYKKLPLALYQIQTKYRDEFRPRFGLMRGREFIMKDLYTFHANQESLDEWYQLVKGAYNQIFTKVGLRFRSIQADSGQIGGSSSEEFMALCEIGEDTIVYSDQSDYAVNSELTDLPVGSPSPDGKGTIKHAKGIEVGHIFKLGTKYSMKMRATFIDKDQEKKPIIMGCYGIGISRLLMAVLEQSNQDFKVLWPDTIAPFQVHLLAMNPEACEVKQLYQHLIDHKIEVLLDDRDERMGVKFADADLIGIRYQIVIGRKASENIYEVKDKLLHKVVEVGFEQIVDLVKAHGSN